MSDRLTCRRCGGRLAPWHERMHPSCWPSRAEVQELLSDHYVNGAPLPWRDEQ